MKKNRLFVTTAALAFCSLAMAANAEEVCMDQPCDYSAGECFSAYAPCPAQCSAPCDDYCSTPSLCGMKYFVSADYLYWKLCVDDLDYAAHSDAVIDTNGNSLGTKNGTYKYVNPSWNSGFRVSAGISELACNIDVGLIGHYTRINSCDYAKTNYGDTYLEATMTHTFDVVGPSEIDTVLFATLSHELTYQDYDALFTTSYCLKPCHTFRPYFGVAGVIVDHHLLSTWQQDGLNNTVQDGTTTWNSCFSGVGLKVGSEYAFTLCRGLILYGAASGTVTVGENDSEVSFEKIISATGEDSTSADYTFKDGECIFVPGYHISVGMLYEMCLCNCRFDLKIGYDFLQWHNLPNIRRFLSEGPPEVAMTTSPTVSTIGFHGLTVGVAMQF